ncbi:HNH protein [Mycobacterium phage DS6A]|uniref:HNH protein n=1 Tax=Mycobacterium phage DS6A TaxID=45764 RepID=G8I4K7_9CAUD|nr:HNH protein [Mycobacterium phage DS6A]AER47651.1 HNH protein [Mycobacterium phage DS6A]
MRPSAGRHNRRHHTPRTSQRRSCTTGDRTRAMAGRSVPARLQRACFRRDRYTCDGCGYKGRPNDGTLHCDHIVRRADGGLDVLGNVRTLCVDCHTWVTRQQRAADLKAGRIGRRRPDRQRPKRRRIHPAELLAQPAAPSKGNRTRRA